MFSERQSTIVATILSIEEQTNGLRSQTLLYFV